MDKTSCISNFKGLNGLLRKCGTKSRDSSHYHKNLDNKWLNFFFLTIRCHTWLHWGQTYFWSSLFNSGSLFFDRDSSDCVLSTLSAAWTNIWKFMTDALEKVKSQYAHSHKPLWTWKLKKIIDLNRWYEIKIESNFSYFFDFSPFFGADEDDFAFLLVEPVLSRVSLQKKKYNIYINNSQRLTKFNW